MRHDALQLLGQHPHPRFNPARLFSIGRFRQVHEFDVVAMLDKIAEFSTGHPSTETWTYCSNNSSAGGTAHIWQLTWTNDEKFCGSDGSICHSGWFGRARDSVGILRRAAW